MIPSPALSSGEIRMELEALRHTGRLLYVAAHPDDENTRLITYYSRARGFAVGYLSLTRGDGGQNLIGPELGAGLGAIRTHELLAARALDGGQQFFTRAVDFGYCKDYREALRIWDREAVLGDVTRVIELFRPDVIVCRFSPEPSETHGHHTASTVLALDAFAQLPPERRPRRVFWNIFQWPGRPSPIPADALSFDVGTWLPLMGASVGEIATKSRAMHRSQGMGAVASRGKFVEHFKLLAGEPARDGLFDGVDTGWTRFPGGAAVGEAVGRIAATFDAAHPEASVPALVALRGMLRDLPVPEHRARLDRVLVACLGLHVETQVQFAEVVPGEVVKTRQTVVVRAPVPVRWHGAPLAPNEPLTREGQMTLPINTPMTQPYWLVEPGTPGTFAVSDPRLTGLPEGPPAHLVTHAFEVDGELLEVPDQPVQVWADPVKGEQRRALTAIPPVSLAFVRPLELWAPGSTRTVELELTAARGGISGPAQLVVPPGWSVQPEERAFSLTAPGESTRVAFEVTAPAVTQDVRVHAVARVGGVDYRLRRVDIKHDHMPHVVLQPPAELHAVCLELATRGRSIGYLPGAGDAVDAALERMGYAVTRLTDADLTALTLAAHDAVVLGVRALNTRPGLAARVNGLYQYAAGGGTVVVQYNTSHALVTPRIAPYPLMLSRDRVTDERCAVTQLAPEHPALRGPNRIGPADFEGWVQERGLYFPSEWDPAFTALLEMHDPGEPERRGSLLVARHGRGWFVYTGLSFFRQLPAGVPGAYRLFANLVSLDFTIPG